MTTNAYGAYAADKPLEPIAIERRAPGPNDVQIEIAYCGVCHSDLHTVRSEWGGTLYPCVPGHEIVGHVSAVGSDVSKFAVGDTVGVGCLVDSCQHCPSCAEGLEQYCENGFVGTYNSATQDPPGHTLGGYAQRIVVDEKFVLRIRHSAEQLAAVAPLLCAGITTWSPLRHWKVGPGQKVGIVGIGGLGHMGVKLAHALGAHVVAFTTSESKRQDALDLGADEVVVSRNVEEMADHRRGEPRSRRLHQPSEARRHFVPGRSPRASPSLARRRGADLRPPLDRRLADRRHRRNPGDARFLRRARNRLRHRDDLHPGDRRSL
jgi:uncharacterized zinc-type alcohol dehydrogenase-like protein